MGRKIKEVTDKELKRLLRNLGRNVRELRDQSGMTLLQLASKSKLAISTITEVEKSGVSQVELGTITSLARGLGVDPLKLLE